MKGAKVPFVIGLVGHHTITDVFQREEAIPELA